MLRWNCVQNWDTRIRGLFGNREVLHGGSPPALVRDETLRAGNVRTLRAKRGERRQLPRYHPSCAGLVGIRFPAHLSVVVGLGTTQPDLLANSNVSCFLRPAARGRVPGSSAIPGLSLSPGRFDALPPYSSPSSRAGKTATLPFLRKRLRIELYSCVLALAGDRQRAVRNRRAGRPSGERERLSGLFVSLIA